MAAAVLGHAARRLSGGSGGALGRTALSRLSSRFAHTAVPNPCTCGKFEKDTVLKGIQRQKDALYDAIAEAQKVYGKDKDSACRRNGELLQQLSIHVDRSGDPNWGRAIRSEFKHKVLYEAGCTALIAWGSTLYFKGFCALIDRKHKK